MDKGDEIKIWAELIYQRSTPNHIKVSLVLIKLSFFMLPELIFAFRTETYLSPVYSGFPFSSKMLLFSATLTDTFYIPKLEEANYTCKYNKTTDNNWLLSLLDVNSV